jgi:hypothetical protein
VTVAELVSAHLGAAGAVVVSREPSRFAHNSRGEVLRVRLDDGTTLRLFRKAIEAEHGDHPDKLRRDREPLVYRSLLAEPYHPVPHLYGSAFDPRSQRSELLLEHVDGWPLVYHGLPLWVAAVRQLAVLHADLATRAHVLERSHFLLRLDGDYFRAWAERAFEAVSTVSSALEHCLRRIVDDYRDVTDCIAEEPLTLVHNDLAAKNVIVDTATDPSRIAFVDWEMAGAGCGLLDLAHLMHGFGDAERRLLISAYWSEIDRGRPGGDGRRRNRVLTACEIHNALYRLAHVHAWRLGRETVAEWVEELERMRRTV